MSADGIKFVFQFTKLQHANTCSQVRVEILLNYINSQINLTFLRSGTVQDHSFESVSTLAS